MKKIILALITFVCTLTLQNAYACTDIFINKGGYHIQGRTMDFPINMAVINTVGFINQQNTTDVVLDVDKIPVKQLTSWTNKYGYFGRAAFSGPKMVDGMNTEGFSFGALYLPGSQFPTYNLRDSRPVVGVYDLGNYLLSQASSVSEAIRLIRAHQIVGSAIEAKPGYFIKDIPIHLVLRDKTGNSAVVEFINGQVQIYENSGNILANEPNFDWQLKNADHYNSLLINNTQPNAQFSNNVYMYNEIYNSDFRHSESNLLGVPGDFTSASRFARSRVILNNYAIPTSTAVALYQADRILASMNTPLFPKATATIWSTIKDLDNKIIYYKDYGFYQGDGSFYAMSITGGYVPIDLKVIHFNAAPSEYLTQTIQPTDLKQIKQIISADAIPVFKGVD